ncbi:MAG: DUF697 domain-containing protein [Methylococcaceae bacterium]|nr:MAG: DUF697 domain-containing protein [Methylococcaceae bacterium]
MAYFSRFFDRRLWQNRVDAILHPSISEQALDDALRDLRRRLPVPVIWLLGKAQSGKTSIVRALTGADDAAIGNGFQPCTQRSRLYDFPDAQTAFIRFLDTRGLGEVAYDPREDLAVYGSQAHLLLVTLKAMDHQQAAVLDAVQRIHKSRPLPPMLVAQTCLHEGYPSRATEHPLPYPFSTTTLPATVPADLARSLLQQRADFKQAMPAGFVALDFTQPEDGYAPVNYGLEALWDGIEAVLPQGVTAMLRHREERRILQDAAAGRAHAHIIGYALSAGLAESIPIPAASLVMVLSIQAKLFHSIAALYGVPLTRQTLTEISGAVGMGYLAGLGGRELVKLIPGYGQTVGAGLAALYAATVTYALGKTFCAYFALMQRGQPYSAATLRQVYAEEFQRGRELLRHCSATQMSVGKEAQVP